jgi:polar amino acid transport system permease protein
MIEFTLWDIVRNLLLAARWTVLLSLVAFVSGGAVGLLVLLMRTSKRPPLRRAATVWRCSALKYPPGWPRALP